SCCRTPATSCVPPGCTRRTGATSSPPCCGWPGSGRPWRSSPTSVDSRPGPGSWPGRWPRSAKRRCAGARRPASTTARLPARPRGTAWPGRCSRWPAWTPPGCAGSPARPTAARRPGPPTACCATTGGGSPAYHCRGSGATSSSRRWPVQPDREQVAWLAVQFPAQGAERGEPDRPGPAVLEHGEVGQGDTDPLGQLGQGHAPPGQQLVQVQLDLVLGGRHQTTASSSSRKAQPRRTTSATASSPKPTRNQYSGGRPAAATPLVKTVL